MTDRLAEFLNRPLVVGNRTISGRLALAPMSQLGHIAMRELLASFGGYGLLFSEMCAAARIPHEKRADSDMFRWREQELPHLVCQIVGHEPVVMAAAARTVQEAGFLGIDINFGCAAAAICRRQRGAALLKQPARAAAIVAAVRRAVSIPVFVKFRTGWQDSPRAAVDLARRFEACGADALTFHPRVAPDRRSRPPRWEYIGLVKQAVSIPVFGNGNVFSRTDCANMLALTGCDGVALGRMAVARPWVFAQWASGFLAPPEIYADTALRLADLLPLYFDEVKSVRRFKKFALYFAANFRFGHSLYTRICSAADMPAIRSILASFFRDAPDLSRGPNMNLFNN
ncbi:MAG: tRNA-dihydrouridine synthase family protein [Desulfobacterales bacterium]